MNSLSTLLQRNFSQRIRARGKKYYYNSRVSIVKSGGNKVIAKVKGTTVYTVQISQDKDTVTIDCNCPYFIDYGPCKHIWATLLAAEIKGSFQPVIYTTIRLRYGSDDIDRLEYDTDVFDQPLPFVEDTDYYVNDFSNDYFRHRYDYRPNYGDQSFETTHDATFPEKFSYPVKRMFAPSWRKILEVTHAFQNSSQASQRFVDKEIIYVLDCRRTLEGSGIIIETCLRKKNNDGCYKNPRAASLKPEEIEGFPDTEDRRILWSLLGLSLFNNRYFFKASSTYAIPFSSQRLLIPDLLETNRFYIRGVDGELHGPLQHDTTGQWELRLDMRESENGEAYTVTGDLWNNDKRRLLQEPLFLTSDGYLFWPECSVSSFDDRGCFQLVAHLRGEVTMLVPKEDGRKFIASYLSLDQSAPISLPPELRYDEVKSSPDPLLKIWNPRGGNKPNNLYGELLFIYGDETISSSQKSQKIYQQEKNRLLIRDAKAETAGLSRLLALGFKKAPQWSIDSHKGNDLLVVPVKSFYSAVSELLLEGWQVEGEGALYRKSGNFSVSVISSGIDWFDLTAECNFDGIKASLPKLLKALRNGDRFVQLGDGSKGMLPSEWMKKYASIAQMGEEQGNVLRFRKSQVLIIDMLLQDQPDACCDEVFERARCELKNFSGVHATDPPAAFTGKLRPYQREGLGWFLFLQRFGFGGCLADDMGLGKTVQVLALLAHRHTMRKHAKDPDILPGPSLVIVPRSLIYNWKQEAKRFIPDIQVLDFSHSGRSSEYGSFEQFDLILATYGTLRRDITKLKTIRFDYVILDEAQAIKNANTATAKAARLLNASYRLTLSGTPVENHLGELWSIFEFLNPRMLGTASAFRVVEASLYAPEHKTVELLRRAMRPFILRRTKAQVASDLPPKLEETLYCEMDQNQRKLYNELREHYRNSLLDNLEEKGIKKIKIQILEALLRLRQAACHPGLIDKKRTTVSSAKLEALLGQLDDVLQEGHKALIFSQFTSMLAIVKKRLDKEGILFEYLDGRTRNRQKRIERFQNDSDCMLFLISLKAGGLGLNLTAAEYVFLLDPWWNPAVEAQAIDRTHRIGQTNPVFAYRLICKDTVEEKVLELQKTKRKLADSIITADNSMIRTMRPEDLKLLLS